MTCKSWRTFSERLVMVHRIARLKGIDIIGFLLGDTFFENVQITWVGKTAWRRQNGQNVSEFLPKSA